MNYTINGFLSYASFLSFHELYMLFCDMTLLLSSMCISYIFCFRVRVLSVFSTDKIPTICLMLVFLYWNQHWVSVMPYIIKSQWHLRAIKSANDDMTLYWVPLLLVLDVIHHVFIHYAIIIRFCRFLWVLQCCLFRDSINILL